MHDSVLMDSNYWTMSSLSSLNIAVYTNDWKICELNFSTFLLEWGGRFKACYFLRFHAGSISCESGFSFGTYEQLRIRLFYWKFHLQPYDLKYPLSTLLQFFWADSDTFITFGLAFLVPFFTYSAHLWDELSYHL